jgi:peptidoglycan/xylan/chitin deacetylase (PgdA/CDA1 family)
MYHVIDSAPLGAPYPELYVPVPAFVRQVHGLAEAGYQAVTLSDIFDAWYGKGAVLPQNPVVLSFDDGYPSHVTHALPVLDAMGWPGVLSLQVARLGEESGLTAAQVGSLVVAGWELSSHTINHPDLAQAKAERVRVELTESRARLESEFGVDVPFFCYPFGRYTLSVRRAVCAAGYRGAMTTHFGLADPRHPYELARVHVNAGDDWLGVERKFATLAPRLQPSVVPPPARPSR